MLTLSPQVEVTQRIEKDVVFVVDTSGTMATDGKMEQAQKALEYMIAKLDPADRFAVVDFATERSGLQGRARQRERGGEGRSDPLRQGPQGPRRHGH